MGLSAKPTLKGSWYTKRKKKSNVERQGKHCHCTVLFLLSLCWGPEDFPSCNKSVSGLWNSWGGWWPRQEPLGEELYGQAQFAFSMCEYGLQCHGVLLSHITFIVFLYKCTLKCILLLFYILAARDSLFASVYEFSWLKVLIWCFEKWHKCEYLLFELHTVKRQMQNHVQKCSLLMKRL